MTKKRKKGGGLFANVQWKFPSQTPFAGTQSKSESMKRFCELRWEKHCPKNAHLRGTCKNNVVDKTEILKSHFHCQ